MSTRPLPEGMLACRSCGFAVPTSAGFTVVGTTWQMPQPGLRVPARWDLPSVRVTLCRPCSQREERAERGRLGAIAHERLVAALDGVAALGLSGDHLSEDVLIRYLSGAGNAARWVSKFVPIGQPGQDTARAANVPWAHVTQEVRQSLREGYGKALAVTNARLAPEREIVSPSGPCLMCGIDHVLVAATRVIHLGGMSAASNETWRETSVSPTALGGKGASMLHGHLCPACSRARSEVGSIGHRACEVALAAHLIASDRLDEAQLVQIEGLSRTPAHAARRGRSVNSRPWAHIAKIVPAP